MNFTFKMEEFDNSNNRKTEIEIKNTSSGYMSNKPEMENLVKDFENFLKACGYNFKEGMGIGLTKSKVNNSSFTDTGYNGIIDLSSINYPYNPYIDPMYGNTMIHIGPIANLDFSFDPYSCDTISLMNVDTISALGIDSISMSGSDHLSLEDHNIVTVPSEK